MVSLIVYVLATRGNVTATRGFVVHTKETLLFRVVRHHAR